MRTIRVVSAISALCMVLAAAVPAVAQKNPGKDGEPADPFNPITGRQACTTVPDDAYDGTIGSMTCQTINVADPGLIDDVDVVLGVNHSWVGDMTVKVVSPAGTVVTVMSRPGFAEPADDGTLCCGDSSNIVDTSPVTFDDSAAVSAEDMGSTIAGGFFVCQDDGICNYSSFPDTGPGTNLDDFDGEPAAGDWMVCVGDGAGGDEGEICDNSEIIITRVPGTPTLPWAGMVALIALLSVIGLFMLRRKSTAS